MQYTKKMRKLKTPIKTGQIIGLAGYTGRFDPLGEGGTHLHFQIQKSIEENTGIPIKNFLISKQLENNTSISTFEIGKFYNDFLGDLNEPEVKNKKFKSYNWYDSNFDKKKFKAYKTNIRVPS